MTKHDSFRCVVPTEMLPKLAQSTCACSPGSTERRKKSFVTWLGPDAFYIATHRPDRARIAALCNHLEKARRAQARVLFERRTEKALIRLENRGGWAEFKVYKPLGLNGTLDGLSMQAELGCNGAKLPMLGEEEPPNAGATGLVDHRATSKSMSCRRSPNSPTPERSRWRRRFPAPRGSQSSV